MTFDEDYPRQRSTTTIRRRSPVNKKFGATAAQNRAYEDNRIRPSHHSTRTPLRSKYRRNLGGGMQKPFGPQAGRRPVRSLNI
ncbi:hypothetical protein OSTOST_09763 [Ostertagia ostertagi]